MCRRIKHGMWAFLNSNVLDSFSNKTFFGGGGVIKYSVPNVDCPEAQHILQTVDRGWIEGLEKNTMHCGIIEMRPLL